ncbi:unnamed protein product [Mytilus coruscus]|uniref:MEGF10_11 n=1 Tax=Mytilus coruscus TaxID=42192 RepID=A0A6J8ECR5_MYTCO|nr:unnamed protein product [Mytilus coruscus]
MILKSMFLCLLSFCICLEDIRNACKNRTSGNYYCCSDYVEKDGKCVACGIGFTSYEGQQCRECNENFFGYRCITKCNCQVNQECHHIHGCIGGQSFFSESTATHSISGNSVTTTLSVHTVSYLVPTEQPSGFQLELLIYSASVTGVILIFGICYLCRKYNTRRHKSSASVTVDEEVNQNDPPNESHDIFELSEGLYHTIDEEKNSISSVNDNPYLEVVNGSSGSDSIKNDNGETTSYPPPYCRQITTSIDKHPYENSRPDRFESHDQISAIQETDQDYLTPSKPTIDSSVRCETEIFAMVHAETYSSSGSDNEKTDKNDGIDYLNLYQPLEKCNQTERDHGYDIPLTSPAKLTPDNVVGQPVEQL